MNKKELKECQLKASVLDTLRQHFVDLILRAVGSYSSEIGGYVVALIDHEMNKQKK